MQYQCLCPYGEFLNTSFFEYSLFGAEIPFTFSTSFALLLIFVMHIDETNEETDATIQLKGRKTNKQQQ